MRKIKLTGRQITMGFFTMLALVLIIAGLVAEVTLHFATKTTAIESAPPPPPPVIHQTIVNHYYGPGGQPMGVPQIPEITTTTEHPRTLTGGIPKKEYLKAVRISQMIKKKMDETEDKEQLQKMESNLNQLLTKPDKDTLLEHVLGKKLSLADFEDYTQEEEKMAKSLQALMEGPMSEVARVQRTARRGRAIPIPERHRPMTRAVMRGLCSRLQDMEYDGATYKSRTLDMTLQKTGMGGVVYGIRAGWARLAHHQNSI